MSMRPGTAEYLGDGVYAEFDGFGISVDLRGEGRPEKICLEPEVFEKLKAFGDKAFKPEIELEVCENVEWLTVFGILGRLDLSDCDPKECVQRYCSKLHALLTEAGFKTTNAKGQRITCHGWNGFNLFSHKFGNVGTFSKLTPAQEDAIVEAIENAFMFAIPGMGGAEIPKAEWDAINAKSAIEDAAPDLLAACRGWEAVFRQHGAFLSPLVMTALKATMAAITKAERGGVDTPAT